MDVAQAIADFIKTNGVAVAILLFMGWFLTIKIWPWYTKEYWPVLVRREEQRDNALQMIGNNLIELKKNWESVAQLVDRNYTASRERDELVLESLSALHARLKNTPLANGAEVAREMHGILKEGK